MCANMWTVRQRKQNIRTCCVTSCCIIGRTPIQVEDGMGSNILVQVAPGIGAALHVTSPPVQVNWLQWSHTCVCTADVTIRVYSFYTCVINTIDLLSSSHMRQESFFAYKWLESPWGVFYTKLNQLNAETRFLQYSKKFVWLIFFFCFFP